MAVLNDAFDVKLAGNSVNAVYLGGEQVWPWTPARLFANGEQGVWYEPKPEYLYQDAAGTTPVTADGDPVGYMQDLSGNGNHATQSTSAARPIYRTDGTLHWLEFDGVDDYLLIMLSLRNSGAASYFAAISAPAQEDNQIWGEGNGGSPGKFYSPLMSSNSGDFDQLTGYLRIDGGSFPFSRPSGPVAFDGTRRSVSAIDDTTAYQARSAGVFGALDSYTDGPITIDRSAIGALPIGDPTGFLEGNIYAVIAVEGDSSLSQNKAHAYLDKIAGVTI